MLSLTLALLLTQTPAVRRTTPASDDPGMVVRPVGTANVNCTNCGNIFLPDGGNIGSVTQGRALDGGTGWGVYIEGGNLSVTAGVSFDGGSIGYLQMPDGGPLEVYAVNGGGSAGGGWAPDGGFIGSVSQGVGQDGGAWNVTNAPNAPLYVIILDGGVSGGGGSGGAVTQATLPWLVAGADGGAVRVESTQMSDWVPNPASVATPGAGHLHFDTANNLMVRGQVTTDEGMFSDGFSGSALATLLTGTATFTNGSTSVTGAGTAFTTEVTKNHYVKASGASETAWGRVARVISDTELELEDAYIGTTVTSTANLSNWVTQTPVGATMSVAASVVSLTNSTVSGDVLALYRSVDYSTLNMTVRAAISARYADQPISFAYVDALEPSTQQEAEFRFSGTDNTQVECMTAFDSGGSNVTTVTIPGGGNTSTQHTYEVSLGQDRVTFVIDGILVATHQYELPDAYRAMTFGVFMENSAVLGASATVDVSWVHLESIDRMDTLVTNPVAARLQAQVQGAQRTGDAINTNPVIIGGSDGAVARTLKVATSGAVVAQGDKTNNLAASDNTNVATLPSIANTSAPTYTDGNVVALSSDTSGQLRVTTSSLPLPTGAATAANQTSGNASLTSIDGKTPALVSGRVPVDGSGVTQPVSGSVTVTQGTGTNLHVVVDSAPTTTVTGTVTANAGTGPWPVTDNGGSLTVDGTVAATQSGTWNVTNISGTVSLPTGAATETTLGTRLADSTFTGRFPASATLADATANPSLTASASYLFGYNGTTWDRLRKSAAGLLVDIANTSLAVTQSGSWSVAQSGTWNVGLSAGTNYIGKTRLTDGSLDVSLLNSAPGSDTGQVALPVRIISSLAGGAGGTSSSFGSAFPASGTAAGFDDGTNMSSARTYDTDTGGGTQNTLGVSMRVSASGGSAEAAAGAGTTSASTLRVVLPTDQSVIPINDNGGSLTVDGTVAATQSGTWNITNVSGTVSLPTGAATETTLGTRLAESTFTGRFPAAGALSDATANPTTTGTAVYLMGYNGTTWDRIRSSTTLGITVNVSNTTLAVTQSGTWNVGLSAGTNYVGKVRQTDGTLDLSLLNSAPGSDTGQVAVPVRVISSLASAGSGGTSSNFGAAFPAAGTAAGFSDGTNMETARVFDADTGGGTQNVLGTSIRVSASGGSTEAAAGAGTTSTSTLRVVLPTDQTAIPVTDNGSSLTVDGTVALSGTSAVNVSQVGGNAVNVGSGAAGTGTQRVILATDQSVVPINDNGGSLTVDGTVGISGTVAATQSGTWSVRAQDGSGNALASSTTTPAGTEQALITRNIPSGTQTISGTVTANAGTGPFPVSDNGGSLTVDGTVAVSAVSGSVTVAQATASNLRAQTASESATGSAVPATASAVGMSDGTNLRIPQVYDTNNDVATEWTTGVVLRAAVFGGSEGYGLGIDGSGNLGLATWNLNKLTNTVTSTAVTCATTATAAPTTPSTDRTTLTLYNNSSVTIYIGGSGVTTSNGIPLLPGASFTDDTQRGAYYCRVASGTADLRVMEQ